MKTALRKIGFIDSGVGGFSVLNTLAHTLPADEIYYLADAAHLPYGQKTHAFLLERGRTMTLFLQELGVTTIFIACHTLSATVLNLLQAEFPQITYIDMVPVTISAALAASNTKRIGIMATQATINSGMHKRLLLAQDPLATVIEQACPQFVPLIENSSTTDSELAEVIHAYLENFATERIDTIILGCTHYWFIQKQLQTIAPAIAFISAGNAYTQTSSATPNTPIIHIITTKSVEYLEQANARFFEHSQCCPVTLTAITDFVIA